MGIKITKTQKKSQKEVTASTKKIKSCSTSNISANPQPIQGDEDFCPECGKLVSDCECVDYEGNCLAEAQDYIKSAISVLSQCASDDPIIKDNIANLSVVLLDLTTLEDTDDIAIDDDIEEALSEVAGELADEDVDSVEIEEVSTL